MTAPFVSAAGLAVIPRLKAVRGVVLDLDAVLTYLPSVHAAAWQRVFDGLLREVTVPEPLRIRPFDVRSDYRNLIAGRGGAAAVAAFLASRGMKLPLGPPADPPGFRSLRAVEAYHDRVFGAYVRRHATVASPGAMRLVSALTRAGVPVVVSSPLGGTRDGVVAARRTGAGLIVALDRARSPRTELALMRAGAHLVLGDTTALLEPADTHGRPGRDPRTPAGVRRHLRGRAPVS
ncbi:hypothetical protein SRB5_22380 [Streptomyces sp. RB5]|uniref:Hydrolase n=1 Tax=Streptomyces smaragdinus TaxID=2585196 RepID=A0A7K0CF70_9ACTN|nr:hypothetical protein [Streptomyces smaragdinus]MQY12108.1 hypothetical protein [Streptomyces smaragdinus]